MKKIPPQALNVEESILGALVIGDRSSAKEIMDNLAPEDFYDNKHQSIFVAAQNLQKQNRVIDMITLEAELGVNPYNNVDIIFLSDLTRQASSNVESGISIIKEKAIRRNAIERTHKAINDLYDETTQVMTVSADMSLISDDMISGMFTEHQFMTAREVLERDMNSPVLPRLYFGDEFTAERKKLDEFLFLENGAFRGEIITILADSSHGKTQLMMYLAGLLGRKYKGAVCQLEGRDSKTSNFLALNYPSAIDNILIRSGVCIWDDLEAELRTIHRNEGLDFFCIDYIQLLQLTKSQGSLTLDITKICSSIMNLASELDAVAIVTSQVTIPSNTRGWDREPRMENAMWASAIKHMAHICLSVFRPKVLEELVVHGAQADYVKGWHEEINYPYNSVFIKQQKLRDGELSHDRIMFVHEGDKGLILQ